MSDSQKVYRSAKGQAMPGPVSPITSADFEPIDHTEIRWLGGAGIMINSRGTVIMIDPVLEGFDMPLLIQPPISSEKVPRLDGLLVTHIDNDHFSVETCKHLSSVCKSYHAPHYVSQVMREKGINGTGHDIDEKFSIGQIEFTLTPTWHNWQNDSPEHQYRVWKREDYCGFWIETVDGSIWLPGDSRLLQSHLEMKNPDAILFDFSDNDWHIGLDNAIKLANIYEKADLICIHWGTVDAHDFTPFNADPEVLMKKVKSPERVFPIAPGLKYTLKRK